MRCVYLDRETIHRHGPPEGGHNRRCYHGRPAGGHCRRWYPGGSASRMSTPNTVITNDRGPADEVTPSAAPPANETGRPKTVWTLTTQAGRSIECFSLAGRDRIEVVVHYDRSPVISQSFEVGEEDLALIWAEQQRLLRLREVAHRLRCPRCDEAMVRSRTRGYEYVVKLFTRRRPHRCTSCGWRGWRRDG